MLFIGWVMTVNGFIACQTTGYFQLPADPSVRMPWNWAVEELRKKLADVLKSVHLENGPLALMAVSSRLKMLTPDNSPIDSNDNHRYVFIQLVLWTCSKQLPEIHYKLYFAKMSVVEKKAYQKTENAVWATRNRSFKYILMFSIPACTLSIVN